MNLSDAARKRLADRCLAVLNNPEVQARTREINKKRCGPLSPSYGKKPPHTRKVWYQCKDGQMVCFRSSWEARFATYLDTTAVQWSYEPETFPVRYMLADVLIEGTYTPDFLCGTQWFEVKGRWTDEGRAKFDAFCEQYPEKAIEVIDRMWLKRKGLL